MCGIYGAIGSHADKVLALQWLCYLNESRGSDSAGIASDLGISRRVESPAVFASRNSIPAIAGRTDGPIVGHTRFATHGPVTKPNAHPFRFGNTIGAHNGVVQNLSEVISQVARLGGPSCEVDSQYLIWLIDRFGSTKPARGGINVAWFRRDSGILNLQRANNPLACVIVDGSLLLFSSLRTHLQEALEACAMTGSIWEQRDETVRSFWLDNGVVKHSDETHVGYNPNPEWIDYCQRSPVGRRVIYTPSQSVVCSSGFSWTSEDEEESIRLAMAEDEREREYQREWDAFLAAEQARADERARIEAEKRGSRRNRKLRRGAR